MDYSYTTNPLKTSKYLFQDEYQLRSIFGSKVVNYDSLRRLSSYFKERYQKNEKFVRCFLSIDAFASGADFDGSENNYVNKSSNDPDYNVSVATVDSLYKVVYSGNDHSLTFTDSDGYVYCLTSQESAPMQEIKYLVNDQYIGLAYHNFQSGNVGLKMYIQDITGTRWQYLPNLIEDIVDNGQILSAYSDSIDAILSNHNINSLSDVTDKYVLSARTSVVNAVNDIKNIFASAGFGGFLSYLSSVITTVKNALVADDGKHLIITDNDSLMPSVFLAGTYEALTNSVVLMLAALASTVSVAAGLLVAAVGTLISFINNKINYSYDTETLAAVNEDGDLSCFPMACGRMMFSDIPSTSDDVADQYLNAYVPITFRFGPAEIVASSLESTDASGFQSCFETHIDSVDRRDEVKNFLKYRFLQKSSTSYDTEFEYDSTLYGKASDLQSLRDVVLNSTDTVLVNSESTGVLSEADDLTARCVYQTNLVLFIMMCNLTEDPFSSFIITCGRKHTGGSTNVPFINGLSRLEVTWNETDPFAYGSLATLLTYTVEWAHNNDDSKILSWANLISISEQLIVRQTLAVRDWTRTNVLVRNGAVVSYLNITPYSYYTWFTMDQYQYYPLHPVVLPLSTNGIFALNIPKYDRRSFYEALKSIIACTAVSVIVFSTLRFTVKSALSKWAMSRAITAENLWNNAVQHPDDPDALKQYRSYTFKNNLISRIFGGTIYDRTNFWGGSGSLAEAKIAGYAKAFLTGGAGGVIASHLLGDEADSAKKVINHLNTLIIGS